MKQLGLERQSASSRDINYVEETDYQSLSGTTLPHPAKPNYQHPACVYRGIVPAYNITEHDLAINGAIVSARLPLDF
jgi:dimethylaniline monooxygenase (N-oxide forming)